jgi:hypothetical protein
VDDRDGVATRRLSAGGHRQQDECERGVYGARSQSSVD